MGKIIELGLLAGELEKLRLSGKKIVLSHGCFDLIHPGHIKHFRAAKKMGDVLVVTVTPNMYVEKGRCRPVFDQGLRVDSVAALDIVDYVAVNKWPTAVETIRLLKPDIYTKAIEYKFKSDKRFAAESAEAERAGGEVRFTTETAYSSSNLVNRRLYGEGVIRYLEGYKKKYAADDLFGYLNGISRLKVLIIGELIIDEYCSGVHMGKARRESIAEFMADRKETFIGGIGIIANQLARFASSVDILTFLGDRDSRKEFVESRLDGKIGKYIFTKKDSPTPVKTRYIEERVNYRNLFKVTVMNDRPIDSRTSGNITETLNKILPKYDLVIVADYGHGMITGDIMREITRSSGYLAVSTQVNAENKGYNTIDRYPKMDYGCINEESLRLVNKDKHGDINKLIAQLTEYKKIKKLAITMGYRGCVTYSKEESFYAIPAFSIDAIDAMGASEVFFALTSPLAKLGAPLDIVGFIGNAAGAMCIKVIGSQEPFNKDDLFQYLEGLMK